MDEAFEIRGRRISSFSLLGRVALVATLTAACTPSAWAQEKDEVVATSDDKQWLALRMSGCIIVVHRLQFNLRYVQNLRYEGACNASGMAEGPVTLIEEGRNTYQPSHPINYRTEHRYPARDGLLDGAGNDTKYGDESGAMIRRRHDPSMYNYNPEPFLYRGGCRYFVRWGSGTVSAEPTPEDCNPAVAAALRDKVRASAASKTPVANPPAPIPAAPAPLSAPDVASLQGRAERGDATAQFGLAERLFNGTGLAKDLAQAIQWYRRAADQGHDPAQLALGLMYRNGNGVTKDFAQAAQWLLRAAEKGNAQAQRNMGSLYFNGEGVPKDRAQAVQWYRRAAEQGDASGQSSLGGPVLRRPRRYPRLCAGFPMV